MDYCCGFAFCKLEEDLTGLPISKGDVSGVTLIRKAKDDWQNGLLNGIGGKIEEGESPAEAMAREFKEETGVDWPNDSKQTIILSGKDWTVYFFAGFYAEGEGPEDHDTDEGRIETHWLMDLNQLPTIPNLQWLIPMQLDNLKWPIEIEDLGEN